MRGIKKCLTTIYRVKKYRDTGIPLYFVNIINRRQLLQKSHSANRLQCSHRFSLPYTLMILYVNFLPVDVVVMLLAFMLEL